MVVEEWIWLLGCEGRREAVGWWLWRTQTVVAWVLVWEVRRLLGRASVVTGRLLPDQGVEEVVEEGV